LIRYAVAAGFATLALTAAPGSGQRLAGTAAVSLAEHRVDIGAGVEVSSGPLFAAGLRATIGSRWIAGLDAMAGSLRADEGGGPDRDVGQLRGTLGFRVARWLTLEAALGTRVYTAAIARQRWTAAALGAETRLPFGSGRLEGVGRIALQPVVTVSDLGDTNPGVLASAGLRYSGRRATLGLSYWIERNDFAPVAGVTRRERLAGLMVRAAWSPTGGR
jgi:hypothetical protein